MAAAGIGFNAVAVLLLLAGWYGAAGEGHLSDAVPWANLSATGLVCAAVGNATMLAGARARIGERQRVLALSRWRRMADLAVGADPFGAESTDRRPEVMVGLADQSLFHMGGCRLVEGKAVSALSDREVAHRSPCGWCMP
jgi:hypothetical protein